MIAGRVLNGATGAPLPRARVQLDARALLTDSEGRFRFEQPGDSASSLRVTKPGFWNTPEQMDGSSPVAAQAGSDPTSLAVVLWPEAILAGTVLAPDGSPLPRIRVSARHSIFDEQGHHFVVAGQTQTDSRGQFRIPVAAGDYAVDSQFSPNGFDDDEAVLPATFPANSAASGAGTIHIRSGQEQHIELRPTVSQTHRVTLPVESGSEAHQFRVMARSSNGVSFSANGSRAAEPGTVRLDLPAGDYSLQATRLSRDGIQFGDSSVTVADHDVVGPPLRLSSLASIPIDLIVDSSATTASSTAGAGRTTLPMVSQFNLVFEPLEEDSASFSPSGIRPVQHDGVFSAVAPPGTYRLSGGLTPGWYIRSATSGGTDLLRDNLVVAPASSPPPVTIVVSNGTGSVQGSVRLSGSPCSCWVYLIANSPAIPPVIIRHSDSSGNINISDVPPGSYRAVAFLYRHSANLEDPAVLGTFTTHVADLSVTSGNSGTVELDAVTSEELAP